jgi:hypothetical protein
LKLGGKEPKYYTAHDLKIAKGFLVNSGVSPVVGHGIANVHLYPNGLAEIIYSVRFGSYNGVNTHDYGLNRDMLHSINAEIPIITPMYGGRCTYYHNQMINTTLQGYGGIHEAYGNFWLFARMYTDAGDVGGWEDINFSDGDIIEGICYGTYERL